MNDVALAFTLAIVVAVIRQALLDLFPALLVTTAPRPVYLIECPIRDTQDDVLMVEQKLG